MKTNLIGTLLAAVLILAFGSEAAKAEFMLTAPSEIGAVIPKTEYQYSASSNEWIMIPQWLAGTWCEYFDPSTEIAADRKAVPEEKKGKQPEVRLLTMGMKVDHRGTAYHYAGVPWIRCIEQSGLIERQLVESFKQMDELTDGFSILSIAQVTISDAKSGAIKEKFKQQILSTYLPVSPGKIRIHTTTYRYSSDNALISRTEQSATAIKLTELIQTNNDELNVKFRQFLDK